MTDTANLGLPCIEGSQAQKHVTHNDALRILDTLVQLAVADRDLTAPPGSPAEGQRWIVKATGTGAWAGHDNAIAAWQDGGWQFSLPQTGWVAFVEDEGTLLVWSGTAWSDFFSTVTAIQNLALLGIGTTADATNVLSAKLNNALFVGKTVAEGGDGTLRYKLSKESAAKTLSFLLQDNYSSRAEVGLTGDDDLHFKVSPDGSTWYEGIKIAAATGKMSFPVSGGPREMLAADRTYNVRTDGNDGNNGLADNSGGAWLTFQNAINAVAANLDFAGHTVTITHGSETGKTFSGQLSNSALDRWRRADHSRQRDGQHAADLCRQCAVHKRGRAARAADLQEFQVELDRGQRFVRLQPGVQRQFRRCRVRLGVRRACREQLRRLLRPIRLQLCNFGWRHGARSGAKGRHHPVRGQNGDAHGKPGVQRGLRERAVRRGDIPVEYV